MKRLGFGILLAALGLSPLIVAQSATQDQPGTTTCETLATLTIPNIMITSARNVAAGPFTPGTGGRGASTVPAFCRVSLVATPTADSRIAIEVWMPAASAWNGKLLGTDNGGFSGAIDFPEMVSAIGRGYAAVGTDAGHTGDQMEFGQGHPDKIVDLTQSSNLHMPSNIPG